MDISSAYFIERDKNTFGSGRLLLNNNDRLGTPDRHHTSLARIEWDSKEIGKDEVLFHNGIDEYRYVLAKDISFDMFISLYDVNARTFAGFRASGDPEERSISQFLEECKKRKMENVEMRAYGMQDNGKSLVGIIDKVLQDSKASLVEVDIFGKDIRNLAFDIKTGMVFNLLLLNRIYRPGELANKERAVEKPKSQLKFNPG